MENGNYDETPRQMSEMNADGQNEKKRSSRFLYKLTLSGLRYILTELF
jgi:hypothetical protein